MDDLFDGLSFATQLAGPHVSPEHTVRDLERRDHHFHERAVVVMMRRDVVRPEVERVAHPYLEKLSASHALEALQVKHQTPPFHVSDGKRSEGDFESLAHELSALVLSDSAALARLKQGCHDVLRTAGDGAVAAAEDVSRRPGDSGADVLDLLSPMDELENSMEKGDAGRLTTRQRLLPCVVDLLTPEEAADLQRAEERNRCDLAGSGSDGGSSVESTRETGGKEGPPAKPLELAVAMQTLFSIGVEDCLAFEYWQYILRRACEGFTRRVDRGEQQKAVSFILSLLRHALSEQLVLLFELFSLQCVSEYSRMSDDGRALCAESWHSAALLVTERWSHLDAFSYKRVSDAAIVACVHMDPVLSVQLPTAPWAERWFEKPLVAGTVSIGAVLTSTPVATSPHLACVLTCICSSRSSPDCSEAIRLVLRFVEYSLLTHHVAEGRCRWTNVMCREAVQSIIESVDATVVALARAGDPESLDDFSKLMRRAVEAEVFECEGEDDLVAAVAINSVMRSTGKVDANGPVSQTLLKYVLRMQDASSQLRCVPALVAGVVQREGALVAAEMVQSSLTRILNCCGYHVEKVRLVDALSRHVVPVLEPSYVLSKLEHPLFALLFQPILRGGSLDTPALFCCPPASCSLAPARSDMDDRLEIVSRLCESASYLVRSFIERILKMNPWWFGAARGLARDDRVQFESIIVTVAAETEMMATPSSPLNHVTFVGARTARHRSSAASLRLCSLLIKILLLRDPDRRSSSILIQCLLSRAICEVSSQNRQEGEMCCFPPAVLHRTWRWVLFLCSAAVLAGAPSLDDVVRALPGDGDWTGCDPVIVCQRLARLLCRNERSPHPPGASVDVPAQVLAVASAGYDIEDEDSVSFSADWCRHVGSCHWTDDERRLAASSIGECIVAAEWLETITAS